MLAPRSCLNLIVIGDAVMSSTRDSVGNERLIGAGAKILAVPLENHAAPSRRSSCCEIDDIVSMGPDTKARSRSPIRTFHSQGRDLQAAKRKLTRPFARFDIRCTRQSLVRAVMRLTARCLQQTADFAERNDICCTFRDLFRNQFAAPAGETNSENKR